ncbi:peptidoglycan-binding protein [Cuneatibacter caecimuris]|uniref:Putative peptidoglycan binding protein n=1 Tax=Cuneatibacter caecimuris TaxID=1796618 RepID=A0A4Q7PL36_9FIRM|nr:peptidoglycan-binding protein [Cuneatibacter caecimuris]RZT01037.1 putative peptidoglycan binding protein [Cuneatibacter caecimuris]
MSSRMSLKAAQAGPDTGQLQVDVTSASNQYPIPDARVSIARTEEPEQVLEELETNGSGQTEEVTLRTPPLEYSMEPEQAARPYAEYTLTIQAEGFEPAVVAGSEVLPGVISIQPVRLKPLEPSNAPVDIFIPDHTLYGEYPPKIAEAEIKPTQETGEIVLSRVVVPETVVVHDGVPTDASAPDYFVPYRDYIKNVASSEIYATWPYATIVANILAIMSFTLNRVYTEWYRNKGYDFTITTSTAFDMKWIYGRNIFQPISEVVDEIFDQYLSRPEVKQPILTQFCDGQRVTCPNWMSQWGSKYLGDQGYSPIEILRNYYGSSIYINSAEQISGIPSSWPGYDLTIGSSGNKVRQLQEQLQTIAGVYTAIPSLMVTGYYDEDTANAVREFQSIFGLGQTGITDFPTWYKISQIYVGVTRIAELQ